MRGLRGMRGMRTGRGRRLAHRALPCPRRRGLGGAAARCRCAPGKHVAQGRHSLRTVGRPRRKHPVDDVQKLCAASRQVLCRQRWQIVVNRARCGRRRWAPQQQVMQGGTQGVQVGPRALLHRAGLGVLLDGRIGRLENGRERLALVADDAPRSAEVQQHRVAIRLDLDVVGRDVAVVHALGMQALDGAEQRLEQGAHPAFIGRLLHVQSHVF